MHLSFHPGLLPITFYPIHLLPILPFFNLLFISLPELFFLESWFDHLIPWSKSFNVFHYLLDKIQTLYCDMGGSFLPSICQHLQFWHSTNYPTAITEVCEVTEFIALSQISLNFWNLYILELSSDIPSFRNVLLWSSTHKNYPHLNPFLWICSFLIESLLIE